MMVGYVPLSSRTRNLYSRMTLAIGPTEPRSRGCTIISLVKSPRREQSRPLAKACPGGLTQAFDGAECSTCPAMRRRLIRRAIAMWPSPLKRSWTGSGGANEVRERTFSLTQYGTQAARTRLVTDSYIAIKFLCG